MANFVPSPIKEDTMDREQWKAYGQQFVFTLGKLREGIDFIYAHRIWEGFWKYGWVVRLLVIAGLLVGLRVMQILYHGWQRLDPSSLMSSVSSAMSTVADEGYAFLFDGSMKYILLIFMEIIIFHVCRRSIAILTKEDSEASFSAFIKAQKRMIEVVIRLYILEMVVSALVKIGFSIAGPLDFLQPVVLFAVQCYFLGFAVLDNYHEQFGLTIKESVAYGKKYRGVTLGLGVFLQVCFYLPLAGAVAGPLIAAVVVSLVMFELSDLHLKKDPLAVKTDRSEEVV